MKVCFFPRPRIDDHDGGLLPANPIMPACITTNRDVPNRASLATSLFCIGQKHRHALTIHEATKDVRGNVRDLRLRH